MTPDQLVADLARIAGSLDDVIVDAHRAAAGVVLADVRPPILTGALASTVDYIVDPGGFDIRAGGSVAPYGPIVHAANPFITRALNDREAAVLDAYVAAVQALIN